MLNYLIKELISKKINKVSKDISLLIKLKKRISYFLNG